MQNSLSSNQNDNRATLQHYGGRQNHPGSRSRSNSRNYKITPDEEKTSHFLAEKIWNQIRSFKHVLRTGGKRKNPAGPNHPLAKVRISEELEKRTELKMIENGGPTLDPKQRLKLNFPLFSVYGKQQSNDYSKLIDALFQQKPDPKSDYHCSTRELSYDFAEFLSQQYPNELKNATQIHELYAGTGILSASILNRIGPDRPTSVTLVDRNITLLNVALTAFQRWTTSNILINTLAADHAQGDGVSLTADLVFCNPDFKPEVVLRAAELLTLSGSQECVAALVLPESQLAQTKNHIRVLFQKITQNKSNYEIAFATKWTTIDTQRLQTLEPNSKKIGILTWKKVLKNELPNDTIPNVESSYSQTILNTHQETDVPQVQTKAFNKARAELASITDDVHQAVHHNQNYQVSLQIAQQQEELERIQQLLTEQLVAQRRAQPAQPAPVQQDQRFNLVINALSQLGFRQNAGETFPQAFNNSFMTLQAHQFQFRQQVQSHLQQITALRSQMTEFQNNCQVSHVQQIQALTQQTQALTQSNTQSQRECENLRRQIEVSNNLNAQNAQNQQASAEFERRLNEQLILNQRQTTELSQCQSRMSQLQNQLDISSRQIRQYELEVQQRQEHERESERRIQTSRQIQQRLTNENITLNQRVSQLTDSQQSHELQGQQNEQRIQRLNETIQNLEHTNRNQLQEFSVLDQNYTNLQNQLNRISQEQREGEVTSSQLQNQIRDLTAEVSRLTQVGNTSQRSIEQYRSQLAQANSQIQQQQVELDDVLSQLSTAQTENQSNIENMSQQSLLLAQNKQLMDDFTLELENLSLFELFRSFFPQLNQDIQNLTEESSLLLRQLQTYSDTSGDFQEVLIRRRSVRVHLEQSLSRFQLAQQPQESDDKLVIERLRSLATKNAYGLKWPIDFTVKEEDSYFSSHVMSRGTFKYLQKRLTKSSWGKKIHKLVYDISIVQICNNNRIRQLAESLSIQTLPHAISIITNLGDSDISEATRLVGFQISQIVPLNVQSNTNYIETMSQIATELFQAISAQKGSQFLRTPDGLSNHIRPQAHLPQQLLFSIKEVTRNISNDADVVFTLAVFCAVWFEGQIGPRTYELACKHRSLCIQYIRHHTMQDEQIKYCIPWFIYTCAGWLTNRNITCIGEIATRAQFSNKLLNWELAEHFVQNTIQQFNLQEPELQRTILILAENEQKNILQVNSPPPNQQPMLIVNCDTESETDFTDPPGSYQLLLGPQQVMNYAPVQLQTISQFPQNGMTSNQIDRR